MADKPLLSDIICGHPQPRRRFRKAVTSWRTETQMTRVLVVTSMYPTDQNRGFTPYVAEQVRSLREKGLDVDLLSFDPRVNRLRYLSVLPKLIRALRLSKCDVVHTHHTYTFFLVDIGRKFARKTIPVVLTNHEGEVLDKLHRSRTWHPTSFLRHFRYIKRLAAQRADVTVFVSAQLATAIGFHGCYEVIPCGIDLNMFRPLDRTVCRQQLKLPIDVPIVFFPNRPYGKGKRFGLVKAAFEIFKEAEPSARLIVAERIPYEQMPIYYNASDVVVQASYYEASPTIVKEALACEMPIVSTDSGDTRELVKGIPYCFVCEDDPVEMASRIRLCIGHRATGGRERLFVKGLALEQVAGRLLTVYQQVLSQVS